MIISEEILNIDAKSDERGITIFIPKFITDKKFCEILKIKRNESKRMRDVGEITYTSISGKIWYNIYDVIKLIDERKNKPYDYTTAS